KRGLDESLGLSVCFRSIRLGADVLDAQVPASVAEGECLVATPIVGHDASDGDAETFVIGHRRLEKGNGAVRRLVGLDLGEGDAGVVVNADVDKLPAGAAALVRSSPIA